MGRGEAEEEEEGEGRRRREGGNEGGGGRRKRREEEEEFHNLILIHMLFLYIQKISKNDYQTGFLITYNPRRRRMIM